MLPLKILSYTVAKYYIGLAVAFVCGVAFGAILLKRNRFAGRIVIAFAVAAAGYCIVLQLPSFSFFGLVKNRVPVEEKLVALTFDDGPSAKYTPRILDELKRAGAHATFFVTGEHAARHPAIVRRIADEGHDIGNHTWGHGFLFLKSDRQRRRDILRTQKTIERVIGEQPVYFRTPYEYRDLRLLLMLRGLGLEYIGQSASSHDAMRLGAERIVDEIVRGARPGAIILLHDSRGSREETVRALPIALKQLKKKGFRAVSISELEKAAMYAKTRKKQSN